MSADFSYCRIFYVPGLVYGKETNEQAQRRWDACEAHNKRVDELDRINRLPMAAMREWAEQRGIAVKPE